MTRAQLTTNPNRITGTALALTGMKPIWNYKYKSARKTQNRMLKHWFRDPHKHLTLTHRGKNAKTYIETLCGASRVLNRAPCCDLHHH